MFSHRGTVGSKYRFNGPYVGRRYGFTVQFLQPIEHQCSLCGTQLMWGLRTLIDLLCMSLRLVIDRKIIFPFSVTLLQPSISAITDIAFSRAEEVLH